MLLPPRIALSFETLSPNQVCAAFERALDRPCKYVRVEKIEVKVPIPSGYQHQLEVIEDLFYHKNAPFFPIPEFLNPDIENIPAGNGIVTPAAENPTETSQSTSTSSSTSSSSSSPSSKQAQALSELSLENNSNPNLAHAIAPSSYPIDDPPETPTIGPGGYSKAAPAAEGFGPGGVTSMSMVDKARRLWEGWRDMEEYAREVFPIEEEANGLDWMI